MDNFYFSIDDKSKIEQFLQYTHNPVDMFEKRVLDMKALYVDKVLQTKAIQVRAHIMENMNAVKLILEKLENVVANCGFDWKKVLIEDYFDVYY